MEKTTTAEPGHRNSFAEYAVLKSTGGTLPSSSSSSTNLPRLPDVSLLDIHNEPSPLALPPQSILLLDQHTRHNRPPTPTVLSPVGSPRSTSSIIHEMSSHRDLVAAARREYDLWGAAEEKRGTFKAKWLPQLMNRMKELSEMEAKSTVGVEIADMVELLKTMYSSETVCKEIGDISDKSRQGVIKLQEGLLLVDKAKELLRSALQKKLFSLE
ncbi:hypothetical protein LINGRAHAP2_LOCUS28801 [Linum grandiflorum]